MFTEVNGTQTGHQNYMHGKSKEHVWVNRLCLCVHEMVFTYMYVPTKVCPEALGHCDTGSKRVSKFKKAFLPIKLCKVQTMNKLVVLWFVALLLIEVSRFQHIIMYSYFYTYSNFLQTNNIIGVGRSIIERMRYPLNQFGIRWNVLCMAMDW